MTTVGLKEEKTYTSYDPSDDFRLLGEMMYRLVQSGDEVCDSPLIDKIRAGLGQSPCTDLFSAWRACAPKPHEPNYSGLTDTEIAVTREHAARYASQSITAEDLRNAVRFMRHRSSVATWRVDPNADPAQVAALKEKYPPNKET